MKKILRFITFSAILLMLAGSFFSCGDKEKPLDSFLTIDETSIPDKVEAGIGAYFIPISSNGAWTAVVLNADWCTLTNSTGSGDAVITVNVAENTLYIARSATIKITSGSLTKSVVVNQNAAEEPEVEPFLIVDETPITATDEGGEYSIAVKSNATWTAIVENADWCTLENSTGSGDGVITVNIAENTLYTFRGAIIKITSGGLTKTVSVSQINAECTECPFTEHSVWKYTNANTNDIIEITFYPSFNLMQIKTTPENLPSPPYLFFDGLNIEYHITDNKMYWKLVDGESFPDIYWNLTYPSQKEMVMTRGGFQNFDARYRTVYYFICQTEFNEL